MIGIDEVGRGAWAGPLLVVAVKNNTALPKTIRDSKQTSCFEREILALQIRRQCRIGEGWVTPNEIDEFGMTKALKLATARALKIISANTTDNIIIDGHINYAGEQFKHVSTQIKADEFVPIVSAASIVAKVTRDAYMRQLSKDHLVYGFATNVGYGTAEHRQALVKHGPIKSIHRYSFKPVMEFLK